MTPERRASDKFEKLCQRISLKNSVIVIKIDQWNSIGTTYFTD